MTIARRPGEPPLGNPDADGKVLASTTAGVRSWVAPVDQAHRDAVTGIHGLVRKGTTASIGVGANIMPSTTGSYNVAIGDYALYQLTTAAANVAVGHGALLAITTSGNTAVGYTAGRYLANGADSNQTSTQSCYFGYSTRASAAGAINETCIGYQATGGGSNTVRLGNTAVTHWLPGATNVCALGNSTTAFKELYLHDGTDEWKVTINTSGVLTTTKV